MRKQFVAFISIIAAMTIGVIGMIIYHGNSGSNLPDFPMLTVTGYAGECSKS